MNTNISTNERQSAAVGSLDCHCGFQLRESLTDCPNCEYRTGLEIYRRVKAVEPVNVLFTGVSASPVEIDGKWYWTIDKNFGDTEFDSGAVSVSVTGGSLEELLNLGNMDAEKTLIQLERFDKGLDPGEGI